MYRRPKATLVFFVDPRLPPNPRKAPVDGFCRVFYVRSLFGLFGPRKRNSGHARTRDANPARPPPLTNTCLDEPRDDEHSPVQLQYNSDPHASVAPEVCQCNVKATLDGNGQDGLKNAICDSVSVGR